ncbi:protein of unknown function (DUF222) [Parafrankia irregularis]|uniref:DUF222 domain-containing protein n=1 Tax=Parafrankia irregularis TaxID=795642 RepID=A0A0S4QKY1_9ACTN|nr:MULTISPECIES: DUF222 domain-containing protein [Parafrankia]MBE3201988.1 DUF222 domain-containing protein [Parafrankia sp. CH37]CUU55762.1 protein of unknown function (DUF222) [Parafrankia irregularis]
MTTTINHPARLPLAEADGNISAEHTAFEHHLHQELEGLRAAAAARAAADADLLRRHARLAALQPPDGYDTTGLFDTVVAGKVAGVLRVSTTIAARTLGFAARVTHRLPAALDALAAGILDLPRLHALDRATGPLDDDLAAQVVDHVLAQGPRAHQIQFTAACRRAVVALDPDGAATRSARQTRRRRVWLTPKGDGMAQLGAFLPAPDALACRQRIEQITDQTQARRDPNDTRSRDEIRADTLTNLILNPHHTTAGPAGVEVQVIVPIATLLDLDTTPGELPGYGPPPADIAREIAYRPGSTWRRILVDPEGHLVELGARRYPSPAQHRHIQTRNRHCVFPHCTRPARRCDTDHTHPYTHGGKTVVTNLGPMCRRHHRVRHHTRWRVTQPRPGVFSWTSPTGRHYEVRPHSYRDGENTTHGHGTTSGHEPW